MNQAVEKTVIGRLAGRVGIKFNFYYFFLLVLNLFTLLLALWDVKGLVLLAFTIGYSIHVRLMLTQRDEQRLTNELLEELLERQRN